MNGKVDDDLRALLEVQIGSTPGGPKSTSMQAREPIAPALPTSQPHGRDDHRVDPSPPPNRNASAD